MDRLLQKLICNLSTVTEKEEEWTRVKRMIVMEVNYNKYFQHLIEKNELFTYIGALMDVELPLALGFRNIRMVDPHYSEKDMFEKYIIPQIQMYGSIIKDTIMSKTERVIEVCLENGEMCRFHFQSLIIDYGSQHVKELQRIFDCPVGEITWQTGVVCSYMFSDSQWILQVLDKVQKQGYILTTDSPAVFRDSLPSSLKSPYEFLERSKNFWKRQSFEQKVLSINLVKGNVFLCEKVR